MQRREFAKLALLGGVGAIAAPAVVKATDVRMPRRLAIDRCCGVLVDVQGSFLDQVDASRRDKIIRDTTNFARLLGFYKVPVVVTSEQPVDQKGTLPQEIAQHLGDLAVAFEKNAFDLTGEQRIKDHFARLNRKQIIMAGCETDVCVLQSCLGLISLGYEVYLVEELLFSSSRNVDAALARMKSEGAVLLTYKSLFYELSAVVRHTQTQRATLGPFPRDLPDLLEETQS